MCRIACAQLVLFVLNLLFWIFGGSIACFGLWLVVDPDFDDYTGAALDISGTFITLHHIAIVFIILGFSIFILGFLGCCGTITRHPGLMYFFNLVSGALLIVEFVIIVMAIIYHNQVDSKLEKVFEKKIYEAYGKPQNEGFNKAVDHIQQKLKCCGFNGTDSYKNSFWWNNTKIAEHYVPESCCIMIKSNETTEYGQRDTEECQRDVKNKIIDDEKLYSSGCYSKLRDWIYKNDMTFIGLGIIILFLQLFGLLAGCCLRRALSEEKIDES